MATFVLVHGGWHGAWCWEKIAPLLEREGHIVIAPDLPGHGRDTTPLSARPYERYVPRICEIVDAQAEPVVLVGHSSGGMVISAVAAQRPARVAVLVYLAAFLLPPGVAPPAAMRDDAQSLLAASLVVDRERGVSTVPPERARAVFYGDCTDADAAWAIARLQPEPLVPAAGTEQSSETAPPATPRVYIETLHDKALGPATQRKMVAALPCAQVYTLAADHSPFLSAPGELAGCLLDIARSLPLPTGEDSLCKNATT